MNHVLQEEQMDIIVRFWDDDEGMVKTRYLDSKFLKRPNCQNLLEKLLDGISFLPLCRMLQLSMDGPNVNWSVFKVLDEHFSEHDFGTLINIGSCGLHIVHGAFQTGVQSTGWDIEKVLKAMWRLFQDSPARREIYIRECGSTVFSMKFSQTRWIEDDSVAERAIELWPNIVKVIKYYQEQAPSYRPKNNKSYDTLVAHHTNQFIEARFTFFKYVASILKVYLVQFQTDNPMVPFLSNAIERIFRLLMKMFVKREVTERAATPYKLLRIDVEDKENHLPVESVDLGTATKAVLKHIKETQQGAKAKFKKECVVMLTLILKKLQERCPLKYPIVRNSACISPTEMLRSKDACILKFGGLVQKLFEIDRLTAKESDRAKLQYEDFLTSVQHDHKDKFQAFVKEKNHVDTFLGIYLKSNEMYESLWKVCKIVLTLSHGQAAVERSFSVNKQLFVDNLQETSLVGQKIVYDFLTYGQTAELHEFQIPNGLLLSCRSAHSRYVASLEEKKKWKLRSK